MNPITITNGLFQPADNILDLSEFVAMQAMTDGGVRVWVALPSGLDYAFGIVAAVGLILLVRFVVSLKIW